MATTEGAVSQGCKKVGNFFVSEMLLGEGASGRVVVAEVVGGQRVAAKVVPLKNIRNQASTFEQIKKEITLLKKMQDSPNVVRLESVVRTDSSIYIFMELCEGDLQNYLRGKSNQRLLESEAADFLRHIANGFRALYSANLIHRDIKPANIMLKEQTAKIADFGFARTLETSMEVPAELTRLGEKFSSKCDVWSVGIMLYEMLYGLTFTPWKGETCVQLAQNIQNSDLSFPARPFVSETMKELIRGMLEKTESKRFGWPEVFEHPVIANKNYLSNTGQQEELRKNLSSSCALASIYVQNNRVVGVLDDIEELAGEVPDERTPVYSVKSCVLQDLDFGRSEAQQGGFFENRTIPQLNRLPSNFGNKQRERMAQLDRIKQILHFDRNVAMFFGVCTQKLAACQLTLLGLGDARLVRACDLALLASCLYQLTLLNQLSTMKLYKSDLNFFTRPVWDKFRETIEYYKLTMYVKSDKKSAETLIYDFVKRIQEKWCKTQNAEDLEEIRQLLKFQKLPIALYTLKEGRPLMLFQFQRLLDLIRALSTTEHSILEAARYMHLGTNHCAEFQLSGNSQDRAPFDFSALYEQLDNESNEGLCEYVRTKL